MWGNRRFLPHLSEAEIPPAGVRRKPVVAAGHSEEGIGEVCRRRHGFRNSLRSSVSLCKKRQDFLPLLVCGKALGVDINPLRGV